MLLFGEVLVGVLLVGVEFGRSFFQWRCRCANRTSHCACVQRVLVLDRGVLWVRGLCM